MSKRKKKKTFPTALKIKLDYDNSFIEGCFYFIYRRERIIFHSDNQEEFLNYLLSWSKCAKLMCFINHPKDEIEKNPLNYIINLLDKNEFDYTTIATDKEFNNRFYNSLSYKMKKEFFGVSIKEIPKEKREQSFFNDYVDTPLNIIEVRLNEDIYNLSFRNLNNVIPTKYNYVNAGFPDVYKGEETERELRYINVKNKNFYDVQIKNEAVYLHEEIVYYQKRFYFEEFINIYRDQFSLKDLNFMHYCNKKKGIVYQGG